MRDASTSRRDARLKAKAAARAAGERDGTTFLALPHAVIESAGFRRATHEARSLLIDLATVLRRKGSEGGLANGGLMVERARLAKLGWRSVGTINRALQDLVACGLLVMTRQGGKHRPSLYAVTWAGLSVTRATHELDIDPEKWNSAFRGAYRTPTKPEPASQDKRTAKATAARRASAGGRKPFGCPSDGDQEVSIGPSDGQQEQPIGPSDGLIKGVSAMSIGPSDGHSLEQCHLRVVSKPVSIGSAKVLHRRIGAASVQFLRRSRPAHVLPDLMRRVVAVRAAA